MKKIFNKNISVTHESKKTVVIVNGKKVSLEGIKDNADLISLLNNSNMDSNLISEIMEAVASSGLEVNSELPNHNASEKVECSACNRTVTYAKGACMDCGNTLRLPNTDKNTVSSEVDKKYLNTKEINTKEETLDSDLIYIDRLKDI